GGDRQPHSATGCARRLLSRAPPPAGIAHIAWRVRGVGRARPTPTGLAHLGVLIRVIARFPRTRQGVYAWKRARASTRAPRSWPTGCWLPSGSSPPPPTRFVVTTNVWTTTAARR